LICKPQQADDRERQAGAGQEENEISRHPLSILLPIAALGAPPDVHSGMRPPMSMRDPSKI
jgi:hypothetical protein